MDFGFLLYSVNRIVVIQLKKIRKNLKLSPNSHLGFILDLEQFLYILAFF